MKTRRTVKGQAIILILLILLGLVVIFALFSATSVHVRASPTVQEAVWMVNGSTVTSARVGDKVETRIVVQAVEEYVGSVVVKIRKDRAWWPDSDYQVSTVPVSLRGGEETSIELAFVPDQASRGSLRGYFIEVQFRATGTKWVMERPYPPRLRVTGE